MKSIRPHSAAIFFMTYFHRAGLGGGMPPSTPPDPLLQSERNFAAIFVQIHVKQSKPFLVKHEIVLVQNCFEKNSERQINKNF